MVFTISCCTVLSLLLPAMHLGYGFLPVPRVDLPRSPPRDIARRPPVSFPARCATDPTTATRRWNCRSGLSRSWLLATGCRRRSWRAEPAFLLR